MPTSWDQKRQQIANALAGSGGSGWTGLANGIGSGINANPLLRWGEQGEAAPEMAGSQASADGQMARMAAMPGFNYTPPTVGAAPVAEDPTRARTGMAAFNPAIGYGMFGSGGVSTQQAGEYLRGNRGTPAFQHNNRIRR